MSLPPYLLNGPIVSTTLGMGSAPESCEALQLSGCHSTYHTYHLSNMNTVSGKVTEVNIQSGVPVPRDVVGVGDVVAA